MKHLWTIAIVIAVFAVTGCGKSTDTGAANPICGLPKANIGHFVEIPPGSFQKGAYAIYPEETSNERLHVAGFLLQTHEVTNDQFNAFIIDTGYLTDAERSSASDAPGGGSAIFRMPQEGIQMHNPWQLVRGATWKTPLGPGSNIDGLGNQPVVHISVRDARAYAAWAGGRLPSEAEWEYAATIGLTDPKEPLSSTFDSEEQPIANIWQGFFPFTDNGDDGFKGPAPVGCFPANQLGLFDMIGNVWEWTDTPFGAGTYTIKGGSFLCAENFCRRYRPAARQPQDEDFSTNHIGFRIVKDLTP